MMKDGIADMSDKMMTQETLQNLPALPAEVLLLVSAKFFDDAKCNRWWLNRCYPTGPQCPDCGATITNERALQSFRNLARFTCCSCSKQYRATKGTILEGSSFTPRELFVFSLLIGLNATNRQIASIVGITPESVTNWRDRLTALAEVEQ